LVVVVGSLLLEHGIIESTRAMFKFTTTVTAATATAAATTTT